MKAEELRIGNYIHIDAPISDEGKLIRVSPYHLTELLNQTISYNPVPLTEEWLVKFGFEYMKCGISGADMWQGMGFWTKELSTDNITLRGDKNVSRPLKLRDYYNCEIKYVHQLQNLYYALTGEELKLK